MKRKDLQKMIWYERWNNVDRGFSKGEGDWTVTMSTTINAYFSFHRTYTSLFHIMHTNQEHEKKLHFNFTKILKGG